MEFRIDQWAGAKGLGFRTNKLSITIHCHLLAHFRIRKYYPMNNLKEYIFWLYRNRRKDMNEWDTDIVVLGFMIQIQKYKPLYWKMK